MDLFVFHELLSSSSKSSESEEKIINIIYDDNKNHPKRKKPRVQNFIENIICKYNNEEFHYLK